MKKPLRCCHVMAAVARWRSWFDEVSGETLPSKPTSGAPVWTAVPLLAAMPVYSNSTRKGLRDARPTPAP